MDEQTKREDIIEARECGKERVPKGRRASPWGMYHSRGAHHWTSTHHQIVGPHTMIAFTHRRRCSSRRAIRLSLDECRSTPPQILPSEASLGYPGIRVRTRHSSNRVRTRDSSTRVRNTDSSNKVASAVIRSLVAATALVLSFRIDTIPRSLTLAAPYRLPLTTRRFTHFLIRTLI